MAPTGSTPKLFNAPVELAASSNSNLKREGPQQKETLRNLFEQKSPAPIKATGQAKNGSREGKTSATISGPLNQPQFEGIARGPRNSSQTNGHARSPAPAHKTLFDPNQGVQKKILARPVSYDHSPARSLRQSKPSHAGSPKRPISRKDDNAKPFQPQILRRPAADQRESSPQAPIPPNSQTAVDPLKLRPGSSTSSTLNPMLNEPMSTQPKAPTETHKQTLLSLFSTANTTNTSSSPPPPSRFLQNPHSTLRNRNAFASPAASASPSALSIVSPLTEKPLISTRSRLGSLASIVSTGSQARPLVVAEKRQTTAGDKAFLLGYLGRIASQEG